MSMLGSRRAGLLYPLCFLALCSLASVPGAAEEAVQEPAVGTLLGEPLRASSADEARGLVLDALLEAYARSRAIVASEDEIEALLAAQERGKRALGLTAEDELDEDERQQIDALQRRFARALVLAWKVKQSLYGRYGGRLVYQQLGLEPLDAYRTFLEERQRAGEFSFTDLELEAAFWAYFVDDGRHDFVAAADGDALRAFSIPPWERDQGRPKDTAPPGASRLPPPGK